MDAKMSAVEEDPGLHENLPHAEFGLSGRKRSRSQFGRPPPNQDDRSWSVWYYKPVTLLAQARLTMPVAALHHPTKDDHGREHQQHVDESGQGAGGSSAHKTNRMTAMVQGIDSAFLISCWAEARWWPLTAKHCEGKHMLRSIVPASRR